jgi:UDP-N-acetylglucosamine transferase subunit ALG13
MERKHGMRGVLFKEMIFVTVGSSDYAFERLVKKMDSLVNKIDDEVIMQIGNTKYNPINSKVFNFLDDKEMSELYKKADIIIAHDGAGTLLMTLTLNKPTIVVPRLKKYNECAYKNKFDLAETLKERNRVIVVYDIEKLEDSIKEIKSLNCREFTQNKKLISFLKGYINELEEGIKSGSE